MNVTSPHCDTARAGNRRFEHETSSGRGRAARLAVVPSREAVKSCVCRPVCFARRVTNETHSGGMKDEAECTTHA